MKPCSKVRWTPMLFEAPIGAAKNQACYVFPFFQPLGHKLRQY